MDGLDIFHSYEHRERTGVEKNVYEPYRCERCGSEHDRRDCYGGLCIYCIEAPEKLARALDIAVKDLYHPVNRNILLKAVLELTQKRIKVALESISQDNCRDAERQLSLCLLYIVRLIPDEEEQC